MPITKANFMKLQFDDMSIDEFEMRKTPDSRKHLVQFFAPETHFRTRNCPWLLNIAL